VKHQQFYLIITLFRRNLITEYKHLSRDPQLSSVTRRCQIYIMQLDTLKTGICTSTKFACGIIINRNYLLNNIYSFNSPYFRFKETRFVNFFTDQELSSLLFYRKSCPMQNSVVVLCLVVFRPVLTCTPEWNQCNVISRSCYHRDVLFVIDVCDWTSIYVHFISPLL